MPFTLQQKRRLMRAYAPVLFLHQGERFVPVSPAAYLDRAALWDDSSPGTDLRENWGRPSTAEVFPRAPLLRPGQLTLNPFAAGGDVHFLGEQVDGAFPFTQSDGERALFLDFRGWWEEGALPEFGNEPGKVQETTQNRWAFVERLMSVDARHRGFRRRGRTPRQGVCARTITSPSPDSTLRPVRSPSSTRLATSTAPTSIRTRRWTRSTASAGSRCWGC